MSAVGIGCPASERLLEVEWVAGGDRGNRASMGTSTPVLTRSGGLKRTGAGDFARRRRNRPNEKVPDAIPDPSRCDVVYSIYRRTSLGP